MKNVLYRSIMVATLFGASNLFGAASSSFHQPLHSSRQLVLVTTNDWSAVKGQLQRFERKSTRGRWRKIGDAIPVVVGRNGLGWGLGLHDNAESSSPVKMEGDGKAPAGIFRLGPAFGMADPKEMRWLKVPYQQLTSTVECVDDSASAHYNSIVDRTKVDSVDWTSSEKMHKEVEAYRLGIVVDHNVPTRDAHGGSCIFLHIWENENKGTSGCTAMASEKIDELMHWFDQAKTPLLVQLPKAQYTKLQRDWQLPE